MPRIEKSDFPPVARSCDLRIALCNGVYSSPEPLQCLGTPATECLHREWNQASSRKKPSGVTAVLAVSSSCSRCAIRVGCSMEPRAPLGVGHDDVSVDQRIGGRTAEPVIEASLFDLNFALRICPRSGPRRLENLRRAVVSSSTADPRESVPQRMVAPDNKPPDAASEGVKAVGIELLRALAASRAGCIHLDRVPAPLVSASAVLPPETQRDAEPEARANPKLHVCEPDSGCGPGR